MAASAGVISFHEFARKTGWQNPTDAAATSFHQAYHTDKNFFEYLQAVGYGTQFNDHMGGYRQGRLPWMHPSFFPVQENLIAGTETADADAAFLVDIGGSVGHDLAEFQRYFPDHPGKLILQDLPVVIGQITDLDSKILRMEHDFLTEQPVKGTSPFSRQTQPDPLFYLPHIAYLCLSKGGHIRHPPSDYKSELTHDDHSL